ncbi:MAG TPA: hypothetical protein VHC63_04875 [Acidimicrobiales bacterium]|nr:hypothetical protein [Acidimicrobiales bacterium]
MAAVCVAVPASACGSQPTKVNAAAQNTAAPATVTGDSGAISACNSRDDYQNTSLVAAYTVTIGEIERWHQSKLPAGFGHAEPAFADQMVQTTPVSACFLDGQLQIPTPGGPNDPKTPNRAIVIIGPDGHAHLYVAGFHGRSDAPELSADRPVAPAS